MQILLLTQFFDPEPYLLGLPFIKELVRRGHEVEVLTGFPNYPGGKLYEGYRIQLFTRESIEGVSIIRVPLYPSHNESRAGRVLNYLSFALAASVLGPFLIKRPDVVLVLQGPATIAWPAAIIKIFRNVPIIYHILDLWPDSLSATGMVKNPFILACADIWCKLSYSMADRVTVVSNGLKRTLEERGVPGNKVTTVYNWCDEQQLLSGEGQAQGAPEPRMEGRFNVLFAGNLGPAQALDSVLDAAGLLRDRLPNVQFVFIGDGIKRQALQERVKLENLHNVLFLLRRPMTEMGPILRQGNLLLVHLKDNPLFQITVPSKTQAYMAVGRPILMAVDGDAADVIRSAGAGLSCKMESPENLATAVETLSKLRPEVLEEMGERGRSFYYREMSMAVGAGRFEALFQSLTKGC